MSTLPTSDPGAFIEPTDSEGGLIFAVRLPGDAEQFRSRLGWDELAAEADPRPIWINLDRTREGARRWLLESSGVEPAIAQGLLDEETRPRVHEADDGMLVILRGVNLNPGAEPDELIAVRMWVDERRVITLRQFRFRTLAELRAAAQAGRAPETPGGVLARIAAGLAARLGPSVDNLQTLLDELEATMLESDDDVPGMRGRLAEIRRQAITLRRHLVPQRQAMQELTLMDHPVLARADLALLRNAAEQIARTVDALEEVRDRAAVTQDELRARHEARIGRTLYLLTIVATIALPLGLITGLLGINVGGIPLADSAAGFAVVCGIMALIAVGEIALFRRLRIL